MGIPIVPQTYEKTSLDKNDNPKIEKFTIEGIVNRFRKYIIGFQ